MTRLLSTQIIFTITTSQTNQIWSREIVSRSISLSDNLIAWILAILALLITWHRFWFTGWGEVFFIFRAVILNLFIPIPSLNGV